MAGPKLLLMSALSAGALIAADASAQSSASPQDVTASDNPDLGEVVVTAQKRSERLVDVPISISVVSPEILASTNSKNLNELSGAVPGIQFNGNGGGGDAFGVAVVRTDGADLRRKVGAAVLGVDLPTTCVI